MRNEKQYNNDTGSNNMLYKSVDHKLKPITWSNPKLNNNSFSDSKAYKVNDLIKLKRAN